MMKIVLVDDQTLVRKGLLSIISSQEQMEVSGEARNKKEALSIIRRDKPDLVIVDMHLGKESGFDLVSEARELGHLCKFVVLIPSRDMMKLTPTKTFEADADGYISLGAYPEELIYALQVIRRGRKYYDPDFMNLMVQEKNKSRPDNNRLMLLTSKEKEVLQSLGKGLSNKKIAASLYISENTVKKHVSQILAKLELTDRTQAALYANETGLMESKYLLSI